ncbi:MAG: acyl-CoA dehydrogenase family protein [Deltaproteobacteria bacterium]|nr:acyl-CoA dehydrogenase family protein [Deltaproteobacteria bacterium]
MSDLEAFRQEVRQFVEREAPESLRGRASDPNSQVWGGKKEQRSPDQDRWLRAAAERGLTAPSWPREYGGGGLGKAEAAVFAAELARLKLPAPLTGFGLSMIGPTLLQYGSPALRAEHLPRIVRGEIRWCQGYSEPNAGSDLASLQCSAVVDGDDYVVNGQKTWTSYGEKSDWMFLLVRTDPRAKKQQGITFILVDLATPGITIRPIRLISGASPFCETFLENVRIPRSNVVSEPNQGWTVAKALLGHEREMIAAVFGSGQRTRGADVVVDTARRALAAAEGPLPDPVLRDRTAQLLMDQACFQLTVQRTADGARAGRRPGAESSLFKIYGTELNQRRQELLCSLRGPESLGWEGPGFDPEAVDQTRDWLRSRGNTIEGGTSEVQLDIIAKRVLDLPG